jgi:hypothetical protein
MTAIGSTFSNVYKRHVSPLISVRSTPLRKLDGIPTLIAYVCGYLAEAGERVHLAAVWTRRFRAVQPKQTFHDANLHHPDNGTALFAAQFYFVVLHCRDGAAGAIDACAPQ